MVPNMRLYGILLLITCFSLSVAFNCRCEGHPECCCFASAEYTEFQCPLGGHVVKQYQNYVRVECVDSQPFPEGIPAFNFSSVGSLQLLYCNMDNMTFRQAADHFGMREVKNLTFELTMSSDPMHLTKDMFRGLESLQSLSIQYTRLTFDDDFLENTPNLDILNLKHNQIKEVGYIFGNLPQLRFLDLSVNSITTLPDFVFQNLTNLKILYLWNNRISSLNDNTFSGLKQLVFLEMLKNKLVNVSVDAFADLENLLEVYLPDNQLTYIPGDIFKNNALLTKVKLDRNNLSTSNLTFSNMPKLKFVSMNGCRIKSLPEDMFVGSANLEEIYLTKNDIKMLPEKLFDDLRKVKKLRLNSNKIDELPGDIFSSMDSLEELYLDHNNLDNIGNKLGRSLVKLKTLTLNDNRLKTIVSNAFEKMESLERVDLSNNELSFSITTFDTVSTPFNDCCENLRDINLANNKITEFPHQLLLAHTKLRQLDMSRNLLTEIQVSAIIPLIQTIDLSYNKISHVDFYLAAIAARNNNATDNVANLILRGNPITCDCHNLDLVRYLVGADDMPLIRKFVEIDVTNVTCGGLGPISDLRPRHMTCPFVGMGCPEPCDCSWRPDDNSAIVNCFRRNLTEAPALNMEYGALARRGYVFDRTVVDLTYNELTGAPGEQDGYDNVTVLDLSGNKLESIDWVPPQIKVLNMSNNRLSSLDKGVIRMLESRESMTTLVLQRNPWKCDCSAVPLQKYLREYAWKVDEDKVKCANLNVTIVGTNEICKSYLTAILASGLTFLLLFAIFCVFFYLHEPKIKMWLYGKRLCLWFVTEKELDRDKAFDVFVSYANRDEDFILDQLLPNLRRKVPDLKYCLHQQHFVPGELIMDQVQRFILNSRRTLVVLSNDFLDSEWCLAEFKLAHAQGLKDGRNRIIVVMLDGVDEKKLSDELKMHLTTTNYARWGDAWFWDRIRYALPHRKIIYRHNQRHANVMLKIDDKFELCKSASSPPPAITLDPGKLREHPLDFRADGEAPLMKIGQLGEVKLES